MVSPDSFAAQVSKEKMPNVADSRLDSDDDAQFRASSVELVSLIVLMILEN